MNSNENNNSYISVTTKKEIARVATAKSKQKKSDEFMQRNLNRLYINIGICIIFMTAELVGGIISGSLAILTDAAHIFSDILGFVISIVSLKITTKPPSQRMSFGYHRAEVIGALLSIAVIWGLTAWLLSAAITRLITPEPVDGLIMLITAIGGLVGNTIMGIVLLYTDKKTMEEEQEVDTELEPTGRSSDIAEDNTPKATSLNMKAAALHVLGDWIQSLGVIIAGAIIYTHPNYEQADPICTLIFAVLVMATTWPIVRDSMKVLMEASPEDIDSEELTKALQEIEDIKEIHDLHIWSLSTGKVSLSCHIVTDNPKIALNKANDLLKEKYRIGHATIQVEDQEDKHTFDCENELHQY